jgi:hypothetical protein
MPNPGPDFLCVGMLKGGTRWLFDQLQYHPDFWMPPIKELHYFDRGEEGRGANARAILEADRNKAQAADRVFDRGDRRFLKEMASHLGPVDIAKYASLFRHKGERISGDITPHYCSLEKDLIREIAAHLPHLRAVLLVRDPVARAWSQISQSARQQIFDPMVLEEPEKFRVYLRYWGKMDRLSSATRAARRWRRLMPDGQFRYFFMDDIAGRPAETRAEIIGFLGGNAAKPSGDLPPGYNPKASGRKLELRDDIRDILAEHLQEELQTGAELFGGHARAWAERYGCT